LQGSNYNLSRGLVTNFHKWSDQNENGHSHPEQLEGETAANQRKPASCPTMPAVTKARTHGILWHYKSRRKGMTRREGKRHEQEKNETERKTREAQDRERLTLCNKQGEPTRKQGRKTQKKRK